MTNLEILNKLEDMAIFKMSLGSKELFHSNFLEFLFNIDHSSFIRVINHLLPTNEQLDDRDDYNISREKENFDICLYHEENNCTVYDLILENKVKSIPYKEQLQEYVDKVAKNKRKKNYPDKPTRYLLLSLAHNIPDEEKINKEKNKENVWTITNYSKLKSAIEEEYKDIILSKRDDSGIYIKDYCEFIGLIDILQEGILDDFEKNAIFKDEEVAIFKKYRLHDLYIKLRCSNFIIQLKKKIEDEIKNKDKDFVQIINKYSKIRKDGVRGIYLNQNLFYGTQGQVAAFIYKESGDNNDIYEIAIQGNEYRHGINSIRLEKESKSTEKIGCQNYLWKNFDDSMKKFLSTIPTTGSLQPKKREKNRIEPFNGRGHGYIFKYKDIEKVKVRELLEIMANDINDTFYS